MMNKLHPALRLPLAALALLLLYTLTIPRNHTETEDAYDFAWFVRTNRMAELMHPHHLLYLPVAKLAFATGLFPDAFAMMLGANVLFGTATVMLLWVFLRDRLGFDRRANLFACLLLAFSYGFWRYAVAVEVYLPALFAQTLLCYAAFTPDRGARQDALAGLAAAFAMLAHAPLTVPLAVVAIPVYFILTRRLRAVILYGVVAAAVLFTVYGVAFRLASPTPDGVRGFLAFLKGPVEELRPFTPGNFPKALMGFGATFISSNYLFAIPSVSARLQAAMPYRNLTEEVFMGGAFSPVLAGIGLVNTLALIALSIYVVCRLRFRVPELKRLLRVPAHAAIFLWTLAYGAFVLVVDPDSSELWICFLLPLAISCGLGLQHLSREPGLRVPLVFAFLLGLQNLACGMAIIHSQSSDYNADKAAWVLTHAQAGDVVFTRDNDVFTRYLRYYAKARIVNCWGRNAAATGQLLEDERPAAGHQRYLYTDVLEPAGYFQYQNPGIVAGLRSYGEQLQSGLQPTADPRVLILDRVEPAPQP